MTASADDSRTITTQGVAETMAVGAAVARAAVAGDLITLDGQLGAGKTQFVRGMAQGLGLDVAKVASPTFVLMHEYDLADTHAASRGIDYLVHIDAYRLHSLADLESIGWEPGSDSMEQELRRRAIVVVEWADRLGDTLGNDRLAITLEHTGDNTRRITLTPQGNWRGRAIA